jgi:hypothetical protein
LLNPDQPRAGAPAEVDRLLSVRGHGSAKLADGTRLLSDKVIFILAGMKTSLIRSRNRHAAEFQGSGVKSCQAKWNNLEIARRRIWNGAGLFRSWEAWA